MNKKSSTTKKSIAYENNPFFIAIKGIELLFQKAGNVAIALVVLTVISALSALPSYFSPADNQQAPLNTQDVYHFRDTVAAIPVETWLIMGLIVLFFLAAFIAVGIIVSGVISYTSAQLARGKTVGLGEAFRVVFANFWGYTWVMLIVGVKTFLWTLLFIIPGIIMSVRYSLAGVAYFDKKIRGNGSVKESLRLTKNAWLTTFASQSLINFVTMGLLTPLLTPGTQAVLYRQFDALDTAGQPKPTAHVLSWLTLLVPIALVVLVLLGLMLVALAVANYHG